MVVSSVGGPGRVVALETEQGNTSLGFNLSHTAHEEGGETVLKMNREIYFSFLHFIRRARALTGICHVCHPSPWQSPSGTAGERTKRVHVCCAAS